MKKTLSLILCALMIMTVAILPISAAGKADWVTGNGFLIDNKNAAVTVKEVDDGVQFTWGGYYTDGVNWGGFASKEKLALDGLKVELRFDKVNPNDDCWISIGLMEKPELFRVSDVKNGRGYTNLIRYGSLPIKWHQYEVIDTTTNKWKSPYNQTMAADFKIEAGTKVTFEVKKAAGGWDIYLNGTKCTTTFTQFNDVFAGDKAHLVVSASAKASAADAYTCTVLSVNGKPAYTKPAAATTAPATADPIALAFAAAALSGAAIVALKKRK